MKIKIIRGMDCYNQKDAAAYLEMAVSTFQYYIYDSSRTVSKIQFIIYRGRRWFPVEYLKKWNERDSNILYAYKKKRKKEPDLSNVIDFEKPKEPKQPNKTKAPNKTSTLD